MGQLTNSAEIQRTLGIKSSTWAAIIVAGTLGILLAAAVVVALNTIGAGNGAESLTTQPVYSRLDDYGLRHPTPVANPAPGDGRLDDYGLRHPAPFAQPATSRVDDYGLRHPAQVPQPVTNRLDDYGLRHPAR